MKNRMLILDKIIDTDLCKVINKYNIIELHEKIYIIYLVN